MSKIISSCEIRQLCLRQYCFNFRLQSGSVVAGAAAAVVAAVEAAVVAAAVEASSAGIRTPYWLWKVKA